MLARGDGAIAVRKWASQFDLDRTRSRATGENEKSDIKTLQKPPRERVGTKRRFWPPQTGLVDRRKASSRLKNRWYRHRAGVGSASWKVSSRALSSARAIVWQIGDLFFLYRTFAVSDLTLGDFPYALSPSRPLGASPATTRRRRRAATIHGGRHGDLVAAQCEADAYDDFVLTVRAATRVRARDAPIDCDDGIRCPWMRVERDEFSTYARRRRRLCRRQLPKRRWRNSGYRRRRPSPLSEKMKSATTTTATGVRPDTYGYVDADNDGFPDGRCCGGCRRQLNCELRRQEGLGEPAANEFGFLDNDFDGEPMKVASVYPDTDHDGHGDVAADATCPGAVGAAVVMTVTVATPSCSQGSSRSATPRTTIAIAAWTNCRSKQRYLDADEDDDVRRAPRCSLVSVPAASCPETTAATRKTRATRRDLRRPRQRLRARGLQASRREQLRG